MDLLEGGKRIGRKEDGCEWSHRGEGQKAGGFGSANYNASRIDCIRIERRVIILGYPLIQRLPAYRCSVEWLIRAKRPLSSPLGRVTARRGSSCSLIRSKEARMMNFSARKIDSERSSSIFLFDHANLGTRRNPFFTASYRERKILFHKNYDTSLQIHSLIKWNEDKIYRLSFLFFEAC